MTSPEVNVGSIVAKVTLDTTGLAKGERDASTALEHGDRLIEDLLKGHRHPSLCPCGVPDPP